VRGRCARGFSSHGRGHRNDEGGAPLAKRSNKSLLEEAKYAMNAIAGGHRANVHYMELHKEGVSRSAEASVLAQAKRESEAECA